MTHEVAIEEAMKQLLRSIEGPFPLLDEEVHLQHLLELSQIITEWKTVAYWLGFHQTAVEDLECAKFDNEGKRQEMLRKWKQVNGSGATYRRLATLMLLSRRKNLAESVIKCSKAGG